MERVVGDPTVTLAGETVLYGCWIVGLLDCMCIDGALVCLSTLMPYVEYFCVVDIAI